MNQSKQRPVRGIAGESITWLELFFDLVAVAAMVVLASALEEHTTWAGIGVFSVTFAAIWMCWSSLALYVNLANEAAEKRTIIAGMAAIAVMAASLLHLDQHANVFAIAFLICRWFTARASLRTGRLLANWSALQLGGLTTPWLISLWIEGPTKYWFWAAGIALDLLGQIIKRDDDDEVLARINERSERDRARGEIRPTFVTADVRGHHLEERLGTFVIIVLGESVLQMVRAVSETHWSAAMWVAAGMGFAILVLLWRLTFSYGFATAPGARMADLSLRLSMPVHLIGSGSLVVFAASLGELIRESAEHVPPVWGVAGWRIARRLLRGVVGGRDHREVASSLDSWAGAAGGGGGAGSGGIRLSPPSGRLHLAARHSRGLAGGVWVWFSPWRRTSDRRLSRSCLTATSGPIPRIV